MKDLVRILRLLRPYRARLILAVLAMLMLAISTGLYPILIDMLTTSLFGAAGGTSANPWGDRLATLLSTLGFDIDVDAWRSRLSEQIFMLFGVVVVIKGLSQAVRFNEMGVLGQSVTQDLRRQLFSGLVRQSSNFFDTRTSGSLVSRVIADVSLVEAAATYAVPMLLGDALRVLVLAGLCVFEYGRMSLIAILILPITALPIVRFGRLLKRYGRQSQEALGDLSHRVTETLGGMAVVKTFVGESTELQKFQTENERYFQVMKRSVLVRALQTPITELIGVAALLLTMAWAQNEIEAGRVRPGEVIAFLLALVLMYEPLKALGRVNGIIMPGVAAAERIFDVVDLQPVIVEQSGARFLAPMAESVVFSSVGFSYESSDRPVLEEISLELKRGRTIALVGPSGSGKSTIARLLPRLYDVSSGEIRIDGNDIREVTLESLRSQIAVVAQENFLFDDSVRANIAYARPDATDEEVHRAAEAANALEFIQALPRGFDTRTGERGVQLSGGQRQRIAIARAFLEDAPILVLDEATSALDAESEREVQKALDRLVANRTTLIIAHRLSTIRNADEIVVLDRGRIVERGGHDSLMANDGVYASLVRSSGEARG